MLITGQLMLALRAQNNENYIESLITCFAAPVIKGLKCAVLLNISRRGEDMKPAWQRVKDSLMNRLSLEAMPVSYTEKSVLVFVYKRELLLDVISDDDTRDFLTDLGYPDDFSSVTPHLLKLANRFGSKVPHEVGIFLGYPLEDVIGFIENSGRNSLLSGYWKVYGDKARAARLFREYRRAEFASAWAIIKQLRTKEESMISLSEGLPAA